jgi:hypothetical protein
MLKKRLMVGHPWTGIIPGESGAIVPRGEGDVKEGGGVASAGGTARGKDDATRPVGRASESE